MIIDPRKGVPPAGTPQAPFNVSVDPATGRTMFEHPVSGVQVIFNERGIVGLKDRHGTVLQTTPAGTLEIHAKRLRFVLDEEPEVVIRKPEDTP